MDWKIELVAIPVTDVDRAKAFYVDQVGFHPDHDYQVSDQLLFGHTDDLAAYFSATPRPSGYPAAFRDVIGDICRHKAPESYLASRFLDCHRLAALP